MKSSAVIGSKKGKIYYRGFDICVTGTSLYTKDLEAQLGVTPIESLSFLSGPAKKTDFLTKFCERGNMYRKQRNRVATSVNSAYFDEFQKLTTAEF